MLNSLVCQKCKSELTESNAYEYRGAIACESCFDDVIEDRDFLRSEIIEMENKKTQVFKGLDLDPTSNIGRANRDLLKKQIEIASKESQVLRSYERPNSFDLTTKLKK